MLKPPYNKNISRGLPLVFSLLLMSGAANAGYSAVRVKCDGYDTETKIFINNKYKGKCPKVDIWHPAGKVTLRAQKQIDDEHEQVFIEQLELVEGVPQRIEVELGATQLTAKAKRARQLEAEKRERLAAQADLKAARAGDLAAMAKIAERYTDGAGIAKSLSKAEYWQKKRESVLAEADLKAAKTGDMAAMRAMVLRFQKGKGVRQSDKQAQLWRDNIQASLAQKDLASAKSGNIKAMKAVSQRYQTGKGLEPSTDQAQYWLRKAEETEQQKVAAAERRKIQKKIDKINYTYAIESLFTDKEIGVFGSTTMAPTATLIDVISTPFNATEQANLSKQLASRPSAWAKPDSMMAKAYQQQQTRIEESKDPLLAAR